ncbi:MAG: hypothetical protein R3C05_28685 [Pirellulaceae bacterium]
MTQSPHDARGLIASGIVHGVIVLIMAVVFLPIGIDRHAAISVSIATESERLQTFTVEPMETPIVEEAVSQPSIEAAAIEPVRFEISMPVEFDPVATPKLTIEPVAVASAEQTTPDDRTRPRASFFGTHAYGNRFVFVLDASPSMSARGGARYQRACDELMRSLSQLTEQQSFYLLRFSWRTQLMFDQPFQSMEFISATVDNIERVRSWLYDQPLHVGGTDPRVALDLAQQLAPDAVFLLSDGEFNEPPAWAPNFPTRVRPVHSVPHVVETIYQNLPLHCIAFEMRSCLPVMELLARSSGGSSRFVPTDDPNVKRRLLASIQMKLARIDPTGTARTTRAREQDGSIWRKT